MYEKWQSFQIVRGGLAGSSVQYCKNLIQVITRGWQCFVNFWDGGLECNHIRSHFSHAGGYFNISTSVSYTCDKQFFNKVQAFQLKRNIANPQAICQRKLRYLALSYGTMTRI